MPTNGSFDDVLVRLPAAFRERDDGTPDLQVYKTNLAITEALVRRQNVPIAATDERALDSDLDRDGQLGTATRIAYDWAPVRSEEPTSELQSLMRTSYAVFCLKKKKQHK